MNKEQINLNLKSLNQWILQDEKILLKEFKFKNFQQSLDFVNQISVLAEAQNHHPDIQFGWGYCRVMLQTHDIKGLSAKDFFLAQKIDQINA